VYSSNGNMLDEFLRNSTELGHTSIKIHMRVVRQLLHDVSSSARLTGLALLVSSNSTTKPFSTGALNALKAGIPVLFLEQDSSVRQDLLALLSDMIDRIKAATFKLRQSIQRVHPSTSMSSTEKTKMGLQVVADHESFLKWLVEFIPTQLHPEAGYQRHIFALKLLLIIAKSGIDPSVEYQLKYVLSKEQWSISVKIFTKAFQRVISDLMTDPFEDVRGLAASLLQINFESKYILCGTVPARMFTLMDRAESKMLLSGRADHADGLARIYAILFHFASLEDSSLNKKDWRRNKLGIATFLIDKLERSIKVAKQNISLAIVQSPMHGVLLSLR
jgi:hypothetical protein